MQAGLRTEKSIDVFNTIGGRREKMLEQNAQRLDDILKKSRMRRQKAPTLVKQAIEDKVYFAKETNEKLEYARKYREKSIEEKDKRAYSDFAKLMGGGEKGEHLFDVGHYKIIKNSARKTDGHTTESVEDLNARVTHSSKHDRRNEDLEHSLSKKRMSIFRPAASQSVHYASLQKPSSPVEKARPSRAQQ